MPKAALLQSSFNCGEVSPLMYGRTDSPRYKQGLAQAVNYIPTLQGPLVRRPGFKYANNVKDSTNPPVLIPFVFSETQAYMLEFGAGYIRFYAQDGQILTTENPGYQIVGAILETLLFYAFRTSTEPGAFESIGSSTAVFPGSILEIGTSYTEADLTGLRYVQNDDVLYIFHTNYPVYKLERFGQDLWEFTQVYLRDGPYMDANSFSTPGDSTEVTLGATTETVGDLPVVEIVTGPSLTVTGAITDPGLTGQVQITTSIAHGYQNGQNVYIQGIVGTTEANNVNLVTSSFLSNPASWTIVVNGTNTFLLIGTLFQNAYVSGGTIFPALFQDDVTAEVASLPIPDINRSIALIKSGIRYWGTFGYPVGGIYAFRNAASAYVVIGNLFGEQVTFPDDTAATAWYMGVYGGQNVNGNFAGLGYPNCGTFHQNRLILAGATNSPQEVDGSVVGDYENFQPSDNTSLDVADNDAFSFELNSQNLNKIQWLSSNSQGLLAGTYISEWSMQPDSNSAALTPTNFNAQQTSYFGSANVESLQIGNAAIYAQRAQRKVREMNFFFQIGTFRSTDLTEISEHITLPTVTKLVLQKETQPLIWAMRSDGNILSMVYNRTDVSLEAGWTRHQLGGQSDSSGTNPIVYSMGVIPSPDLTFDQLWVVVQRYINGAKVYTVEYMTKIFDDSILQEDAFQLDCGGTFYSPKTITAITNASTAVVTSAAHGFSNGNQIRIVGVVGLNESNSDINGNVTITNLVNETTFVVAGVTTNTFQLNDFNGNPISSTAYGAYVSGGSVAKLVTTISGLTWLEGETVGVLTDGGWHPDCVVSSGGVITLKYGAAKVQIGYRYNSQGQLLRAEAGAADGTSIGKTRRTNRVAVQLHRVGDLSLGTSFTNLIPVQFTRSDNQQADEATPLFSGMIREGIESAYDFESQVCFQQSSPLPGSILSITSFMEEFDV